MYRENSADLDRGRCPELKSEEFFYTHLWFMRYRGVKTYSQQNKCYTFSELYPADREPGGEAEPEPRRGSGMEPLTIPFMNFMICMIHEA